MCLSLMRTGAGVIKYAVFNAVLNRFQTYSNSIDCTIATFDVLLCKFFFTTLRVRICFMPFWGSANLFLQILPLPPPPPHEINWSVPKLCRSATSCIFIYSSYAASRNPFRFLSDFFVPKFFKRTFTNKKFELVFSIQMIDFQRKNIS